MNELMVSGDDATDTTAVQAEITSLLEARHRVAPGQDDFQVRNLADIASAASASATVMEYLLASVAAVSLVVGGIGIMNIMLVSVTERTREIGLRMAVGAPRCAILSQFLIEAVGLSLAGGAIGVVMGFAGTYVVRRWRIGRRSSLRKPSRSPSSSPRSSAHFSVTIRP